jgi:hypothetical protein
MKTFIFAVLSVLVAACALDEEAEEETSEVESKSFYTDANGCWNHDDLTGACCVQGSFYDDSYRNLCCPDGTQEKYDAASPGGWTCGPTTTTPGGYVAEDSAPEGNDANGWVRWVGSNYWYTRSQWQSWGYTVFKRTAAAIDLPPASYYNGQYYGDVRRRFRNGNVQTPYYKYYNTTSYYRYALNRFQLPLTTTSMVYFTAFTY